MPSIGEVYHDTNFQFSDGEIGKKLFVVLTNTEPYLIVKTTSKKRYYPNIKPHCNTNMYAYYLPTSLKTGFPDDTIIQLNEIFKYSNIEFLQKCLQLKHLKKIGDLPPNIYGGLLNCLKMLKDDISVDDYEILFGKPHPRPVIAVES